MFGKFTKKSEKGAKDHPIKTPGVSVLADTPGYRM